MKSISRLMTAGLGALALMALLGGAPAPAAAAGGATVYVGAYDPFTCKTPTYLTLQQAIDATPQPKTIFMCQDYGSDPVSITGKSNMKIVAKGNDWIMPTGSGFTGPLIHVQDSINVTIQGFFLDGDGELQAAGSAYGIYYENSSGTITGNHVLRIREEPLADSPSLDAYIGIIARGNAGQKVTISSNTVADYESIGIYAGGNLNAQITKNLVTGHTVAGALSMPQGILLDHVTAGKVSGNKIQNDTYYGNANYSVGIQVYASSHITVSANKITGVYTGVMVFADGDAATPDPANFNTISGNTVTDMGNGIWVEAGDTNTVSSVSPHADTNKIAGNTITSNDLFPMFGIGVFETQDANDDGSNIFAFAEFNSISGNKLYGFCGCEAIVFDSLTTKLGKNTVALPKAGAGAAPSATPTAPQAPALPANFVHHIP